MPGRFASYTLSSHFKNCTTASPAWMKYIASFPIMDSNLLPFTISIIRTGVPGGLTPYLFSQSSKPEPLTSCVEPSVATQQLAEPSQRDHVVSQDMRTPSDL